MLFFNGFKLLTELQNSFGSMNKAGLSSATRTNSRHDHNLFEGSGQYWYEEY